MLDDRIASQAATILQTLPSTGLKASTHAQLRSCMRKKPHSTFAAGCRCSD